MTYNIPQLIMLGLATNCILTPLPHASFDASCVRDNEIVDYSDMPENW
jgi:hypothetical protein